MLSRKQILVVEDNALNRAMLCEILADQYTVLEAGNGQEALDILKQRKENIALILLDVMMPVMDGYTFLEHAKSDPELALIPVIVTTQSDSETDEVAALAHGAADFVPKPYRPPVILHRIASIINLRETAAMVNQLQYDRMTGIYSKEYFFRKVQERLEENPNREYSIIGTNIENFKLYNDAFGVSAGDRLLREIADSLRIQVGEDGIYGRFGADRFVCLRESKREREEREWFQQAEDCGTIARIQNVIIKWGIYEITDRLVPVEQMCDRAMLAVDSIKGQYNRRFAVYDDTLRNKLLREQAITDAMETALNEGQFVVYLQPKYNLKHDCLAGAEALVRWVHPQWGFMSPGEFIPLFEKNGFITRLDRYVWEQACSLLKDWREKEYPRVALSVNVSRADVYQSDLTDFLSGLVKKYGIDPADLHLEITESAYTDNPSQIISTVDQLRKLGFVIEMDDFGSGYSSLNMLNQLKVDVLKLDMKFIQSETAKPAEEGILRFVVDLARWMNLRVVAEGVETRDQMESLREIGCDYVQGYFLAKPMPGGEFEELLRSQPAHMVVGPTKDRLDENEIQRILVVDEDAEYRETVRRTLEGQYQVLEAADAQGGLSCVRDTVQPPVSAVILSSTLPGQGTDLFLKKLRQDPVLWRIPILATMPQYENMEAQTLEQDTDDFLCKRHPRCDLRRRIKRLVDLAEIQERERILKTEAYHDYLTGLLNRRGLSAAIGGLRKEDLPLALYLFDLDNLKEVNDECGHEAGDQLLRSFSELLQKRTCAGDIICRYGGDEFLVILRHIRSVEDVLRKGEDICREIGSCQLPGGVRAACSGGVALCLPDERPSEKLIERADQALYRAKRENKGGCCLWEE